MPALARINALILLGLFAGLFLLGAGFAQEKDKDSKDNKDKETKGKEPEPKLKGFLPAGFKKLGLSYDQVQAIYKIQAQSKEKVEALKLQIEKLKLDERAAIEKVLTPDQAKKLKALKSGEK